MEHANYLQRFQHFGKQCVSIIKKGHKSIAHKLISTGALDNLFESYFALVFLRVPWHSRLHF